MTDLSTTDAASERGQLTYRSGPASAVHRVRLLDDTTVRFGRSEQCEVRIGHEPDPDPETPLVAGWLVMAHGRVIVEAAPSGVGSDHAVRALQVLAPGGPPVPIAAGAMYSPITPTFTIEVVGANSSWTLGVATRRRADDAIADDGIPVELTDDQRTVLLAYAEPVLAGGVEPATHDQVAAKVFMSRSQVRRHLDRMNDVFYDKRLWSPNSGDTRVRVVEAARHNQLLTRAE